MRNRIGWLALLVAAGGLLAPGVARAQDGNETYEVPPPPGVTYFPWPLGHPHYETGGMFVAVQFQYLSQSNPLHGELIALRGVQDRDGTAHTALGIPGTAGDFIGSRNPALDVSQVSGPGTFEPGLTMTAGWRFSNGVVFEASWTHIADVRYSATASLFPPNGNVGIFGEESFLFSPVFNYPINYAGPAKGPAGASFFALSGIWNGASLETIDFVQRFDQADFNLRYPLQQTDCWRMYGLFGPRAVIMWERFGWRTVAADNNGFSGPLDQATYSNIVSNRLYGLHLGLGNEWSLGTTPIGEVAFSLDVQGALFVDFVKGRASYELGDRSTAATRNRNFMNVVPEVQANASLWWYPYEAVQFRLGYDIMSFFNTMASPQPVDFNVGAIAPAWESGVTRFINGLNIGVAIVF